MVTFLISADFTIICWIHLKLKLHDIQEEGKIILEKYFGH